MFLKIMSYKFIKIVLDLHDKWKLQSLKYALLIENEAI